MIERPSGDFIQWLRAFYYIAESGSVSGAAARMGLRQPAVTYLLQALERYLGSRLFVRGQRNMLLTQEGERLMERCIPLFELVREIRAEVGTDAEQHLRGEVSLTTIHAVGQTYLPERLAAFNQQHPQVSFRIVSATEINLVLGHVLGADMDMAIVPGDTFPPSLVARPLFASRLVLAVPRAWASERGWLFRRDAEGCLADFTQLNGLPFIRFVPSTRLSQLIAGELAHRRATPRTVITANNSTLLVQYARAGLGLTVLDDFTLSHHADLFDRYPLPGQAAHRVYHLVTRTNRYLPPQSSTFIRFLLEGEGRGEEAHQSHRTPATVASTTGSQGVE